MTRSTFYPRRTPFYSLANMELGNEYCTSVLVFFVAQIVLGSLHDMGIINRGRADLKLETVMAVIWRRRHKIKEMQQH